MRESSASSNYEEKSHFHVCSSALSGGRTRAAPIYNILRCMSRIKCISFVCAQPEVYVIICI